MGINLRPAGPPHQRKEHSKNERQQEKEGEEVEMGARIHPHDPDLRFDYQGKSEGRRQYGGRLGKGGGGRYGI